MNDMSVHDMSTHAQGSPGALRDALRSARGVLLVTRAPRAAPTPAPGQPGAGSDYVPPVPDIFIALCEDGRLFAFNGHVDLGTGIRTSLAQIVAEELYVPVERVRVVLGHTELTPNQGPTIASATIQISAVPLRNAAAQAREFLLARAAQRFDVAVEQIAIRDGAFHLVSRDDVCDAAAVPALPSAGDDAVRSLRYESLLDGEHIELTLADDVPLKPAADYTIVGRASARVDIPDKATGVTTFVHDMRVPGMLHGRVIRPPYAGRDTGAFVGRSLIAVDPESIATIPSAQVVVIGDFIGVVAQREEHAIRAARELKVQWRAVPPLPDLSDVEPALRGLEASRRVLAEEGDVDAILGSPSASAHGAAPDGSAVAEHAGAEGAIRQTYVWPYQMHASIGPSCALADFRDDKLTVWSGTQNPHVMRIDLARLLQFDESKIEIVRMEAAGCYGRNCADDVGADAALLSRALGRPVRVQLSREQEHMWEPKGAAQLIDVRAAIDANGELTAYDFTTRYPSNDAPILAMLLTGAVAAAPRMLQMGDRTAVPPYAYRARRIVCDDVAPLVRASWLRGVSALPNSFAHDSMIDELAEKAGVDPVAFRLRHLPDARAAALVRRVADAAGWQARPRGDRGRRSADGLLRGHGFAYARYVHSRFPGFGAAWAAWAIALAVDPATGAVTIERIVVGQDTGMIVNPAGVRHQIHGNVVQCLSRVLREEVMFDDKGVVSRDWGAYPILTFAQVPPIEVVLMERQNEPPLGAGESATVPGAAAIANALFDATGQRFRRPPFTPEKILATLADAPGQLRPAAAR